MERLEELWEDLRWAVRRALQRIGGVARRPSDPRAVIRRRRAAAVIVIVLALCAAFRFVPLPGVPCDVSPAKTCVPTDDAIALVPASADAYLHIDLDRDSSQFSTAAEVVGRLPHSGGIEQGLFETLRIAPGVNLRRDVAGWIGDEAAFAELGVRRPKPLALLAIGNREGAARFVAKLGRGKRRVVKSGGRRFHAYRNGLAYAELGNFLALGGAKAVGTAIDLDRGRGKSLADSEDADAARDPLPDQRLADAYVSGAGIKRLLVGRGGLGAQLDTFTDFGASRGIAAALVAHDDGFEVQLDSALGPVRAKTHPSFFQAFPSFDPSLAGEFSPETLLYLNFAKPADTVRALLRQATATTPDLVAAARAFARQVRRGGADIDREVLPALGGEAAVGVTTGRAGPYLTFAFDDVDEERARTAMAQLQAPLIRALSPGRTGQAPSFGTRKIGDTVVHSVRISPALDIAYAIFDGRLVVATNPAGVRQALEGDEDLGGSDGYKAATSAASSDVSALVFLNLEGLVRRAQPLGLGQIIGGFSADVAKLKALGLSVKSDEDSLETTIFLDIE